MPDPVLPLPHTGYLRLPQIIGDPGTDPPTPAIIPVSKSTWWTGVSVGRYPAAVKLGPRITAWRVEDIRALIANGPAILPPATPGQGRRVAS